MIKLFNDNNCLDDVVLIGSWAEYLYQQSGIIPTGTTSLRTLDIDFLVTNLRNLDILLYNIIPVSFFEMNVQVPIPEAYILYKIIINNERSLAVKCGEKVCG